MGNASLIQPEVIKAALERVGDEASFIDKLLSVTLNWRIPEGTTALDEITYEWPKDERKAPNVDKKLVGGRVLEVNLIGTAQHWGVFILEFKDPKVFSAERGMTGVLREVLRWLVPNRRKGPEKRSWNRDHLLFICTHNYKQFRIAYFKDPVKEKALPRLAAFGWETGSAEIRTACEFNLTHLGWPDDPSSKDSWVDQWSAAFDVEKVTKRFYEDYVPAGERTLDRWISSGRFPRPDIAIGGKVRYWRRETVEAWIDAQAQGGGHE